MLAGAEAVRAQDAPTRNGNVWDGRAHQPTTGVRQQERAAGVAPSEQQQRALDRDVEQLGNTVQQQARQPTAAQSQ
jgi:hypothetical protein